MRSPSRLLCVCILLACIAALADAVDLADVKSIPLRTHSFDAPYLDSDMQSRWFDFGGDTVIRTDRYVRLTSTRQSQSGWIFSRVPLTATNWQVEVEFKISGEGGLYGDGFAIWVTKQRAQQGPVFGFVDKFEGLGIFFDTYKNNRPGVVFPYVMAMLGDGNTSYDKYTDGKDNELAGCSARGIRNAGFPTKARLTYFADQNLVLDLLYKEDQEVWTQCFEIPNIKIPSVAYLGFSAETGELSDNHDIISVETKNLYSAGTTGTNKKPSDQYAKKVANTRAKREGSSWTWFFVKVMLFLMCVAGAYVGFTFYRTARRRSKF